jgi:hypothetical protein
MNETICLELTKSHRPTEGNPSYLRKSASICGSAFLLGLLRVHSRSRLFCFSFGSFHVVT